MQVLFARGSYFYFGFIVYCRTLKDKRGMRVLLQINMRPQVFSFVSFLRLSLLSLTACLAFFENQGPKTPSCTKV